MPSRGKAFGLLALAAVIGGLALWTSAGRKSLAGARKSLPKLRRAIVGNTRGAVAAIFGPPHAAIATHPQNHPKDYWHADTWYYPLDVRRRTAVAIRFINNVADHVDFIAGPGKLRSGNRKSA